MSAGEAIVIAASALVDPLVGTGRTLELFEQLEDVVEAWLPGRTTIVLDFTDASESGDVSFWWYHRILYPGFQLIVDRTRERIPAVRQAWVLDHDGSLSLLIKHADRVRGIVMEPGNDQMWVQLMDEIRQYAALISN